MSTKAYINKFPEISNLTAAEQEALLEKARYEAFTRLKLNAKSTLFTILSFSITVILTVSSTVYFAYPSIYNLLALIIGITISVLLNTALQKGLIKQGLTSILAKQAASENTKTD